MAEQYTFDIGQAVAHLRLGKRVARQGWNGKDMWLQLVEPEWYSVSRPDWSPLEEAEAYLRQGEPPMRLLPWVGMKTANGHFVPWLASQTDILAADYVLVG